MTCNLAKRQSTATGVYKYLFWREPQRHVDEQGPSGAAEYASTSKLYEQ